MRSTSPPVLGSNQAALDSIWEALSPESTGNEPVIRAVMISSIDGTTTVDGRSGGLGTPTDHLVFHAMRARADIVLVGSGTALAEGYGPAKISSAWQDRRSGPAPIVLLLSQSLSDVVIDHCVQAGPGLGIVAAHDADPERVRFAEERGVRVHVLNQQPIGDAVRTMAAGLGAREITFEGGPKILSTFLESGAVDELVLSLAPEVILRGDSSGLVPAGSGPVARVPMKVASVFTGPDGGLYTRWIVGHAG